MTFLLQLPVTIEVTKFIKKELAMKKTDQNPADVWAEEVWTKNVMHWENRNQDYNYRKLLARPGTIRALKKLQPIKDGVFLDLGCGDGSEMQHISNFLLHRSNSGTFFGFDLQQSLIEIASTKFIEECPFNYVFDFGKITTLIKKYGLIERVDRVFSTFLLQELSSADSHLQIIRECLKKNGQGIFLLLHPSFGEAMLQKGAVKLNRTLNSNSFRWAGEYPIVEENGNTFYVPYFHRYLLKDYKKILNNLFSKVTMFSLKPSLKVVREAKNKKLSPFYDHPGNVYYPEIITTTSALFFVVTK